MIKNLIILIAAIFLVTCSAEKNSGKSAASNPYKPGETVYVCGCPMSCCNVISRNSKDRCLCNWPLKQGVISRVQNNKIYVTVGEQEKIVFIKK